MPFLCKAGLCLWFILVLSACKVELYSGLDEKQGNEMLALLLVEGINAEKSEGKGRTVKLKVDPDQLASAIEILSRNSYPRGKYATLNDVFPPGGLISTPTEESARYKYSVTQDLAATISNIDGVLTSRVHLVLPEKTKARKKKTDKPQLAKASVFIKHSSRVSLDSYIPQIKLMVANAVEGLKYENIAVVVFPTIASFSPVSPAHQQQDNKDIKTLSAGIAEYKSLGIWIFLTTLLIIIGIKSDKIIQSIKHYNEQKSASK